VSLIMIYMLYKSTVRHTVQRVKVTLNQSKSMLLRVTVLADVQYEYCTYDTGVDVDVCELQFFILTAESISIYVDCFYCLYLASVMKRGSSIANKSCFWRFCRPILPFLRIVSLPSLFDRQQSRGGSFRRECFVSHLLFAFLLLSKDV
jgi:hypothetical protein